MAIKVLVVEDHDDVRAMVVELLRMDQGIVLFEAVNGSDAVDLAGRERPQVVVTDIMMPQMDGLEATKRIKRAWPETKVIVVTAFTQDAYRSAASERGADAFVDKVEAGKVLLPLIYALTGTGSPPQRPGSGH
jgi:two-component system, NarL family, response regulator LiaR